MYVTAALNGDVDNFAELVGLHELQIAPEITTDAKVIPAIVAARDRGRRSVPTSRSATTVASFEGSVAIGAHASAAPDRVMLALRGSGQALYVGLAEDDFVVASEPYGLVEETPTYLRLDGETPANPDNPGASRGQIVVLDATRAGTLDGITRDLLRRHGAPGDGRRARHAEITTRDIDRGDFPHYLLKEISEAPASFRKTLRGKIVERDGVLRGRAARRDALRRPAGQARRRRDPPGARDRPGDRGGRGPEPRRRADRRARRRRTRCGRGDARHRAVGLPPRDGHVRHARGRDQPERHDHRHQPTVDLAPGAWRGRARDREPAQQRPRGPRPTACSTRPTGATWR